jgi:hypothetical protein
MLFAVPQSLQMNARSPGAPSFGAMSATSCIVRPHRLQEGFDSSITVRPDARSYLPIFLTRPAAGICDDRHTLPLVLSAHGP